MDAADRNPRICELEPVCLLYMDCCGLAKGFQCGLIWTPGPRLYSFFSACILEYEPSLTAV